MARALRRIVTGHNAAGKSIVVIDGPPPGEITHPWAGDIWVTDETPADNAKPGDAAARPKRLEPPAGGSSFRFFVVMPEDPAIPRERLEEIAAARFAAMGATHCRVDTRRHPAMHTTRTVDYIVLLSGKVTLLLDEGEVDLEPFDVVVQRGTNHGWVNRTKEPAILAAILIDAKPIRRAPARG